MTVLRIVSVRSGDEVSRAELADDATIVYSGGQTAADLIQTTMRRTGKSAADSLRALARDGWSNGYLMVDLDQ